MKGLALPNYLRTKPGNIIVGHASVPVVSASTLMIVAGMVASPKLLILRFSSIGDIVLTTPVVRCIKQQLPNAEVHFCTKQAFRSVVAHNPYIDKQHYLDGNFRQLVGQLRSERFDYVIDLHNNLRTRLIKTALGVRSFSVDKLNWRKWLYVRWKLDVMPPKHIVDRYLETARPLGIVNDGLGLDYFIPVGEQVNLARLPLTHQPGYAAYAMGGQHATKKLPMPRMIELCRQINYPVVLLGGPEDREAGEAVALAAGKELVYNGCGQFTLNQSASLLQQSRVVFSHDTGLMHIAAALHKRVYSIWGNTTPALGMYPYKTPHVILEKTGLSCRPCSKIGFDQCPLGHFRCMNELTFDFDPDEFQ